MIPMIEESLKLGKTVEDIQKDVTVIKSALIGNALSGDRGLVGKVSQLETEVSLLKVDIKHLHEERARNTVYIKILSYITGVLFTAVMGGIVKILIS